MLQSFLNSPGIYLREVQEELFDVTGTWVSCSTICRTAKRLGLTRQKMKSMQSGDLKSSEHSTWQRLKHLILRC